LPNTDKTVQQPSRFTASRQIFKPGTFRMLLHQTAAMWTDGRTDMHWMCRRRDIRLQFCEIFWTGCGEVCLNLGLCWVWLWTTPFCINMSKLVSPVEWLADWAYVNTAYSYGDKKGSSARAGFLSLTALNGFLHSVTQCHSSSLTCTNCTGPFRSLQGRDYNRTIQNYVFVVWVWCL